MVTKTDHDAVLSALGPCKCPCHDINDPEIFWPENCQGKGICDICKGSGERPFWPLLWAECTGYVGEHSSHGRLQLICLTKIHKPATFSSLAKETCACGGKGLVYDPTEARLLETLFISAPTVSITKYKGRYWIDRIASNGAFNTLQEVLKAALAAPVTEGK